LTIAFIELCAAPDLAPQLAGSRVLHFRACGARPVSLRPLDPHTFAMPKIAKGRLDGLYGMSSFTAAELFAIADQLDGHVADPLNKDDPKWLRRRAARVRSLAVLKEKSAEQRARDKR
jgi:hypothetical protein